LIKRRGDEAKAQGDKVGEDIATHWSDLRASLHRQADEVREAGRERREKHDAKAAQRHAEHAEYRAYDAVDYALFALDVAEEAVLEAIDARAQAEFATAALAR